MRQSLLVITACLALGLATSPVAAQKAGSDGAGTLAYWCAVGITPTPYDTCDDGDPVVVAVESGPASDQRRATVDLDAIAAWQVLVLRVRVCGPTGFFVHIGDSPTNNGFGGDAGSAVHDAEAHTLDTTVQVYRSGAGSGQFLACQFDGPAFPDSCVTQEWRVANDEFSFDPDVAAANALSICNHPFVFDFPPYDETDAEDPYGWYADKLYVGLNRVFDAYTDRTGTGVQEACFYLSTASSPSQAEVTAACGF